MLNESRTPVGEIQTALRKAEASAGLHRTWQDFVRYCADLDYGEIEILKIQGGLPVVAEFTRKRVKFGM